MKKAKNNQDKIILLGIKPKEKNDDPNSLYVIEFDIKTREHNILDVLKFENPEDCKHKFKVLAGKFFLNLK